MAAGHFTQAHHRTWVAPVQHGYRFIGLDLSEEYAQTARERIADVTGCEPPVRPAS